MGGTTSLLDENDWELADGKVESGDDTVDGADPLPKYGVFHLTKKGYNQREYDVTDDDKNLLYTTRQVPGTIACFDVLPGDAMEGDDDDEDCCGGDGGGGNAAADNGGCEGDGDGGNRGSVTGRRRLLLRVEVDLARRYWMVYRYGVPSFPGQKHDEAATGRLAVEIAERRMERRRKIRAGNREQPTSGGPAAPSTATATSPPLLFKRACITVSWSRYMAVSALFGPPTVDMLLASPTGGSAGGAAAGGGDAGYGDGGGAGSAEEDSLFLEATRIADRMRTRAASDGKGEGEEVDAGEDTTERTSWSESDLNDAEGEQPPGEPSVELRVEEAASADAGDDSRDGGEGNVISRIRSSASMPECSSEGVKRENRQLLRPSLSSVEDGPGGKSSNSSSPSRTAAATAAVSAAALRSSMTAANESTRNIRKWIKTQSETIKEKSKRYIESTTKGSGIGSGHGSQHHTIDPLEGVIQLDRPLLLCQEIYNRIIGNHQTSLVSKEKVLELLREDMAQHLKDHPELEEENQDEPDEDNPLLSAEELATAIADSPGNGSGESKEKPGDVVGLHTANAGDESSGSSTSEGGNPIEEKKEQPLVGYWIWENTLRTHKMKLHVAKGADLALHVVMAIIVNQVRYERNAIAMTV